MRFDESWDSGRADREGIGPDAALLELAVMRFAGGQVAQTPAAVSHHRRLGPLLRRDRQDHPSGGAEWLLQRKSVASVIIGARNEEQLIANIGAVGWALTLEQIEALDAASDTPASYPVWPARFPATERMKPANLNTKVLEKRHRRGAG